MTFSVMVLLFDADRQVANDDSSRFWSSVTFLSAEGATRLTSLAITDGWPRTYERLTPLKLGGLT